MTQLLEKKAREAVSREALAEHVFAVSAMGEKIAGSAEEERACAYIVETLRAARVAVKVHTLDGYVNYPLRAELCVTFPEPVIMEAVGAAFGVSTPPEGFSSRVIHVGDGTASDYEDKDATGAIVLVERLPNPARACEAVKRGAAGMICISGRGARQKMVVTPVWGTPGIDDLVRIPRIPVLTVGQDDGRKLARMAESGQLRATLRTENREEWRTLRLPVAEIPGKHPEFLLVGGHYCTWFDGATDNVTGTSCLMEMARVLAEHAESLPYGVKIAWWPGHSQARYAGSAWFADRFWQELNDTCLGYLNIDSPGVRGATTWRIRDQGAELAALTRGCLEEILSQGGAPVTLLLDDPPLRQRPGRNSDQSFPGIGVTSLGAYSMLPDDHPDRNPAANGSAGAWWWHSADETADKFDPEILRADTRFFLTLALRLTAAPHACYDFSALAVDYLVVLGEYRTAAKGRLDFGSVMENSLRLQTLSRAFAERPCRGTAAEREKLRINLQLARILNPVFFTATDRFTHHPAVETPPIPTLSRCRDLGAMSAGAWEGKFLAATLARALTRVNAALLEAIRLLEAATG